MSMKKLKKIRENFDQVKNTRDRKQKRFEAGEIMHQVKQEEKISYNEIAEAVGIITPGHARKLTKTYRMFPEKKHQNYEFPFEVFVGVGHYADSIEQAQKYIKYLNKVKNKVSVTSYRVKEILKELDKQEQSLDSISTKQIKERTQQPHWMKKIKEADELKDQGKFFEAGDILSEIHNTGIGSKKMERASRYSRQTLEIIRRVAETFKGEDRYYNIALNQYNKIRLEAKSDPVKAKKILAEKCSIDANMRELLNPVSNVRAGEIAKGELTKGRTYQQIYQKTGISKEKLKEYIEIYEEYIEDQNKEMIELAEEELFNITGKVSVSTIVTTLTSFKDKLINAEISLNGEEKAIVISKSAKAQEILELLPDISGSLKGKIRITT